MSKTSLFETVYNNNCFLAIFPEIFLSTSLLFLLFFLVIYDYKAKYKYILSQVAGKFSLLILSLTLVILLNNTNAEFLAFNYLIISDFFSVTIKFIVIISLMLCILFSLNYVKKEKIDNFEYFILLLLSVLGTLSIISSYDFITMYLAIELQSLCYYILATFKPHSNFSTEAGIKYFILGAFSSGFLLFGCSLIYGFTGITNFYELNMLFYDQGFTNSIYQGLSIGILFVSVGFLFKMAAAPFHMWAPDVYEGSPTIVTAIFSIIPKIAIIGLFMRLGLNIFSQTIVYWNQLLLISAISSLLIGTLGALYQVKLKRLLAYSAISHIGYLLIGLSTLTIDGFYSILFYLIVYIIISINIFTLLINVRKRTNNLKIKRINELVIFFKANPMLAINFCIVLFSIAGIPPLVGFYSKFYVFVAALKSNLYLITLVAAVISVIASMYYIRLIKLMFFKTFDFHNFFNEISKESALIISYTLLLNILFFFYPALFITFIHNIILNLFF